MQHRAVLLAALVLTACGPAPAPRSESGPQDASIKPIVEFLISSAATDFHTHRPPDPSRFRDVRLGHVMTSSGEKQYLLCGQFLAAQEGGKSEWTSFATIKTTPYEHWMGAQAEALCLRSSITWDKAGDLSSALQSRLDSMR